MFLENLGIDALDPLRLGRSWEAALGTTTETAEPDILETRLQITEEYYLDLCFAQVPAKNESPLRHRSLRGPLLELVTETEPKRPDAKNPIHLDVRLEPGDDPDRVSAEIARRGGREMHPDWGDLPWRVYQDPSGNEFCVLPAPQVAP